MDDPSMYGEAGGIFAGIVALLVAIGNGLRWWFGFTDRRAATRAQKLDAWQRELAEREARFDERIEGRLAELELRDEIREAEMTVLRAQGTAMRTAFQLVAGALHVAVPGHPALEQANEILKTSWPPDPNTPDDLTALVLKAKRSDEK